MNSLTFEKDGFGRKARKRQIRSAGPGIPRVAIARWLYWSRTARPRIADDNPYGEPAWDMLLDLYIHEKSGKRTTVSSLCHASNVPSTTALRYVVVLEKAKWLVREADEHDHRRVFVWLTPYAAQAMEAYFDRIIDQLWEIVPDAIGGMKLAELDRFSCALEKMSEVLAGLDLAQG